MSIEQIIQQLMASGMSYEAALAEARRRVNATLDAYSSDLKEMESKGIGAGNINYDATKRGIDTLSKELGSFPESKVEILERYKKDLAEMENEGIGAGNVNYDATKRAIDSLSAELGLDKESEVSSESREEILERYKKDLAEMENEGIGAGNVNYDATKRAIDSLSAELGFESSDEVINALPVVLNPFEEAVMKFHGFDSIEEARDYIKNHPELEERKEDFYKLLSEIDKKKDNTLPEGIPVSAQAGETEIADEKTVGKFKEFLKKNKKVIIVGAVTLAIVAVAAAISAITGDSSVTYEAGQLSQAINSGVFSGTINDLINNFDINTVNNALDFSFIGEGTQVSTTAAGAINGETIGASEFMSNQLLGYADATGQYTSLIGADAETIQQALNNPNNAFNFGEIGSNGEPISEGWVSYETVSEGLNAQNNLTATDSIVEGKGMGGR